MAAGYFNQQENVAVLASSDYSDEDGASGWAEASLTVAQGSGGLFYGPDDQSSDEDRDETRAMRLVCERGSSRLVAG